MRYDDPRQNLENSLTKSNSDLLEGNGGVSGVENSQYSRRTLVKTHTSRSITLVEAHVPSQIAFNHCPSYPGIHKSEDRGKCFEIKTSCVATRRGP
jgi:hypothetical protein